MIYNDTQPVKSTKVDELLNVQENYFNDLKSKDIKPSKLSNTVSAFANASGGDIYIGISEDTKTNTRTWNGFDKIEDANSIVQMLLSLAPLENFYTIAYLQHPSLGTVVMQLSIMKTATIVYSTDSTAYVRHNAQNDPVNSEEKLRRLQLDKGIAQFENETVSNTSLENAAESEDHGDVCPICRSKH